MNNDNELMKEFNETFGNKSDQSVEPYRATQNQNVVSLNGFDNSNQELQNNNNQNINMLNFVNMNSQINMVPEVANTVITGNNINVNSQTSIEKVDVQQLYDTTNSITDKQVEKKSKKAKIQVNSELKTSILLMIVLLIAMSFIPTLFDLYDSLKIKIFG